ncbi:MULTISPECIES: HNH endonuclease signature motif containing protein [unclassified Rhodococcus (in: high G+C Gram-positive bacteria)]|uniref:HNH endonuclease signature motif containing protein n=1 Tax=unclassified Rhodococcus (in: high G+C Gram-positive bacteria) TaxID=192944 RepID=UPI00211AF9C3|nr:MULTISPECIES: HNH endonuclease signature motif containing protein [unclassified Rhodococcus (in: high G+C Gram-positive bacteria)]
MKTWGDVFGLGDQELVSALAEVSSHESAVAAARYTMLAEIERRGLAMKLGHSTVTRWYARSVRITDGSAARQVELGQWLTDRATVLDALAGGEIHAAHASAIADGYATVVVADPTLDEQRRDAVVAELLEHAMRGTAGQVSSRAQALAHSAAEDARARHERAEKKRREQEREREQEQAGRADAGSSADDDARNSGDAGGSGGPEPAGPEPVPSSPPPVPVSENPGLNRFDVHRLASGRFQIGGDVDRLLAEKLLTVLSTLTAPQPGPGGERDPRSPSKRRADALDRILDRHLRGGSRGASGGSRASVHLIVPLRDLLSDRGQKETASAPTASTTHRAGADGGHRASESAGAHGNSRTSDAGAGPGGGADSGHRVSGRAAGDSSGTSATDARPDRGVDRGHRAGGSSADADGNSRDGDTDAGLDRATGCGQRASGSSGAGDSSCSGDSHDDRVGGRSTDGSDAAGRVDAGGKSVPEPGDAEWPFHFDWTGPMSRSLAELLTCDADLTPVIVDHHGVPLALGRTTRLATDDQRIALTIRDRCCVMCGRPAQWCQAHHVKFWEHGGPTDLNNLALVCGECHRLVHHGDWQLLMGADGHPYAIPPESIDPTRQPIPSYHRRKRRAA